jgi:hypothetical protein
MDAYVLSLHEGDTPAAMRSKAYLLLAERVRVT